MPSMWVKRWRNRIIEAVTDEYDESALDSVINQIYSEGYDDGVHDREVEDRNDRIPWEDLD